MVGDGARRWDVGEIGGGGQVRNSWMRRDETMGIEIEIEMSMGFRLPAWDECDSLSWIFDKTYNLGLISPPSITPLQL